MNALTPWLALGLTLSVTTLLPAQEKSKINKVACVNAAEEAQSAREQKKLIETKRLLLVCASDICPKLVRSDCVKWLDELETSLPTVVIRARDADGHDVSGKVTVDGKPAESAAGVAFPIDPGTHTVRVVLDNGDVIEESLVVAMGEKNRIVTLQAKVESATPETPAAPPRVERAKPHADSSSSAMPWILGGIGVAGLATFGVLQVLARSEYSDMQDGCGQTKTCSDGELSPIRTKFVASGIALGVGVIGIGSSITWLLLDKPKPTERTGRLEISPGIDSARVRYRVHF